MTAETLELIVGWLSFVLTLFIFSYLIADNFLYRLALHILIGTSAGFVAIVAVESAIIPWVRLTILADADASPIIRAIGLLPFMFATLLLLKASPRLAPLGNLGLAFVVGAGVGVAIVGAVVGTILPLGQSSAESIRDHGAINGLILVGGTIATLIYFQYLARRRVDGDMSRPLILRWVAGFGKTIMLVTFGAIYGSAIISSLSVFSGVIREQLMFLLEQIG